MSLSNGTIINRWSEIPYPNSNVTPIGETPSAGSWNLYFLKRNNDGTFSDLNGKKVALDVKTPQESDGFNTIQLEQVLTAAKNLTEQQKKIASYWGAGVPQNQFMPITQCLINTYGVPPTVASRIYNILDMALNDAMIICWYYKYAYQIPRPVQYDNNFKPYLKTPVHPSYPAGHSVFSGCYYKIMSYFFPAEESKIRQVCEECSVSRLYAGVHYPIDLTEGDELGKSIGEIALKEIQENTDKYGATINYRYKVYKDAKIIPISYKNICFCSECK